MEIVPRQCHGQGGAGGIFGDEIDRISDFNPVTGAVNRVLNHIAIYPASHYVTTKEKMDRLIEILGLCQADTELLLDLAGQI